MRAFPSSCLAMWLVCSTTVAWGQDLPTLIAALKDANLRYGASRALTRHGATAVPLLRDALATGSDAEKIWCAFTLGEIGNSAAPAVGALQESLTSESWPLRAAAAEALGKISAANQQAVDSSVVRSMVKLLDDEHLDVRRKAVDALGAMGDLGALAAASVIELLKDSRLRSHAKAALASMGQAAVDDLETALDDDAVRWDVAGVLRQVAPQRAKATEIVSSSVRDIVALRWVLFDLTRSATERAAAAAELATLSAAGREVLAAALDEAASKPASAAAASAAFQTTGPEAVALLLPRLASSQAATRQAAATALRYMQESAADAAKPLAALLDDPDHEVRLSAVRALDAMGSRATPVVGKLIQVMLDEKQREPTRQWAILALANTLPDTRDTVMPALAKASQDKGNYGVSSLAKQQVKKFEAAGKTGGSELQLP